MSESKTPVYDAVRKLQGGEVASVFSKMSHLNIPYLTREEPWWGKCTNERWGHMWGDIFQAASEVLKEKGN